MLGLRERSFTSTNYLFHPRRLACLGRDITQSYVGLTQKKAHFPLPTMNELSFHCCVWPSPSSHTHFFLSGRQKFEFLFYAFIVLLVYAELFASFSVVFSVNRLNQIIKNSMNSQYFLSYQIRTEKLWILLIKNVGMPQLFSRQLFVDSTMF